MANLCVITARGGSKRIPRKNIKDFLGKPIIAYSIEAALKSGLFDEVMVSTDDGEIASIARQYGASVPFMRSVKTSDDYATTNDVLAEVISEYKNNNKFFSAICYLYPTAPFVTPEKLKQAFQILETSQCDFVLPVVKFSYPPQRSYLVKNGQLVRKNPEFSRARSQDLEPEYHDAGQFGIFYTEPFLASLKEGKELNRAPLLLKESEVQDIDTIEDWKIAEIKYKLVKDSL